VFNLSGSEIIFILLLALVVLGPEKLPDALRRAGKTYAELKKMGNTFQTEVRGAFDEPMKEMRETADMLRKAASFDGDDVDDEAGRAERPEKTRVLLRDPGELPPEQRHHRREAAEAAEAAEHVEPDAEAAEHVEPDAEPVIDPDLEPVVDQIEPDAVAPDGVEPDVEPVIAQGASEDDRDGPTPA